MALELPLERLQRWMQAVIVHPGETQEAIASPDAQAEVGAGHFGDVILPSRTLTPTERVGIYQEMYPLRMLEALESDYPALAHFLGHEGFHAFVVGYVQVHPSRHHSLNRLGDHVPEYVRTAPHIKSRTFCHDLARLELAVNQVFDAPETAPLSEAEIAAVPAEAWERARLTPITPFRLLAFDYPVNAYVQSVRDENHDHPKARRKQTWVAVSRRNYGVYRLELGRPAHDLLQDLVGGMRLGEAVLLALRRGGARAPREDELFGWFRGWMAGGVFRAVEID
jgi:hypothetical protein